MPFKISLIIPVFNVETFIKDSLESIFRQTIGIENLEVIMINDCSTDKSGDIIDEYARKYDNFIAIHLPQNSGVAGKPRNVGIEKATGNYIMFLDPDDYYADDACEILHEKITKEDVDIVFGKYIIRYENGDIDKPIYPLYSINVPEKRMDVNNPNEFISAPPSVWTKIFKRNFIKNNNIKFPEGIPGEDLVFILETFFKAKNVIFINKIITNYLIRKNENTSISFNRNYNYINGLIQAIKYSYDIFKKYDMEKYFKLIKGHLIYWLNQFIVSDLSTSEKRDVLKSSSILFKKFHEYGIVPPKSLKPIINLIINGKYDDAIQLSNELNDIKRYQEKTINQSRQSLKKIFILCDRLDNEVGGLAKVVLDRSRLLANNGFDISILTISFGYYESVEKTLRKSGNLHPSVDLINIYDHYRLKNSQNASLSYLNDIEKKSFIVENNYQMIDEYDTKKMVRYFNDGVLVKIKKWRTNNVLAYVDYYDALGIKLKRENYIYNFLKYEVTYYNGVVRKRKHFTKDGFCYLTEMFNLSGRKYAIYLFDRESNRIVYFKSDNEFFEHFLNELCKDCEEKPYLICDGSGPTPSIGKIKSNIAYKISQLHSNPYTGPYCFGGPIRDIGILNEIENNDAFITLTEKQRRDIIRQFGDYDNTLVIPNFVFWNELLNLDKNPNKISLFSRIAPEKNLEDAIKIFNIVVKKRKNARLEIFGRATLPMEQKELKKIKKLIKKYNLINNVFINGHTNDVNKEMEESVATILTSHFEGFGLVLIESMLNSTPVISYDFCYGPSEIIDHGVNGFLVEQYNIKKMAKYIIKLLDNTEKAKKMGVSARKKVLEHYTDDAIFSQWEKLLKKIHNEKNNELKDSEKKLRIEKNLKNISNENKSMAQRLFSKFPRLYILINIRETGLNNAFSNIEGYKIIKKNCLLDIVYYLNMNKNVRLSGMDPILHYIYHGYKEGRNPNPTFDNDYYLKMNKDVKSSNLNPLVHFALYGMKEGRKTQKKELIK